MKYFVSWTEHHSAVVEADNKIEAGDKVYGHFDPSTTFDGHNPQDVIGEDEDVEECTEHLTVDSAMAIKSHFAHVLYDACAEFVRKVECGEARSKRSYKQMKEAIRLADGGTKP